MKKSLLFIAITITSFAFTSCKNNTLDKKNPPQEKEFNDESGIEMLTHFYTEYIPLIENSLVIADMTKMQKANCSEAFYKEYKNWEIDYDPFINAQDASSEWLNSLSIQRLNDRDKTYLVAYISSYDQKTIEITLTLDVIDGKYKIVGIDK